MISIESPMLVLDASTPHLHAGVIEGGEWLSLAKERGDALTLLPAMAKRIVAESGLDFSSVRSFVHCEGPGSLLGLRLCAMMMETWRVLPGMENARLFAYRSLAVEAAILSVNTGGKFFVATQFGKGNYCVTASDGTECEPCVESGLAALGGEVYVIAQRNQKTLPQGAFGVEYDLTSLPEIVARKPELFRPVEKAEAFSPRLSEYKLWDGKRHISGEN